MQLIQVGKWWNFAATPRILAVDTETTNPRPTSLDFELLTVQWCFNNIEAYTAWADDVPICVWEWIQDPNVLKVFHNAKFDWQALYVVSSCPTRRPSDLRSGTANNPVDAVPFRDTRIIRHLIDPTRSVSETLKSQARTAGLQHWTSPLERWQEIQGESAWPPPPEILLPYGAMDAYATWHTYQYLVARGYLDEQEWRLLDVLMQEERALAPMELNGIKLDVPKLTVLAKQYRDQERELYAELKSLTGLANPGSDKQIGSWLYDTRRIPVAKYTEKGGRSVDEDALKRILKRKHLPSDVKLVVEKVLGMRGAQKKADRIIGGKKKTGVSLFENTDEHGILTTRFNQCGTSSGRLSTSPQVQNWDREGPLRECLITRFNDG